MAAGEVISWSSAGARGFKGARKGTPFAAQTAAEAAARRALDQGMRQIEVLVRGPGSGRETAIRAWGAEQRSIGRQSAGSSRESAQRQGPVGRGAGKARGARVR